MNAISWERTPDRNTWRAARGPVLLTVTRSVDGKFAALVERPGVADRAPGFRSRSLAQAWAAQRAGGAQ